MSSDALGEVCRLLKSNGRLYMGQMVVGGLSDENKTDTSQKSMSALKLSGFPTVLQLSDDMKQSIASQHNTSDIGLLLFTASKPSYEVGSTSQLKVAFGKKNKDPPQQKEKTAAVWKLSAMDIGDDDIELVDDDDLLDEEDKKKPDPASLRADCGTGPDKKRKACKNCTCGLADELDNEARHVTLEMHSGVRVVHTWACLHSKLGKKLPSQTASSKQTDNKNDSVLTDETATESYSNDSDGLYSLSEASILKPVLLET
ncbi:CPIN1-like protein, partial [Mya arenaria]